MTTVQLRNPTEGRAYFDKRKQTARPRWRAMLALKPRLSDIVYRHMVDDAISGTVTGRGGQRGTTTDSNAAGSHPHTSTSDKPLPGPATKQPRTQPPTAY